MKIPTTLGLSFLTVLLTLAILISLYFQHIYTSSSLGLKATDVQVVNITQSSVSIIWQTSQPVIGYILWGQNNVLTKTQVDDRDSTQGSPKTTHFVTINNLSPSITYDFKIYNNQLPASDTTLHFKTANQSSSANKSAAQASNLPLTGIVLDSNLQPVKESLVILSMPNASTLATFTSSAGNFILPTADLETLSLTDSLPIKDSTKARLEIIDGSLESNVTLTMPRTQSLPEVVLGHDSDINLDEASSSGH